MASSLEDNIDHKDPKPISGLLHASLCKHRSFIYYHKINDLIFKLTRLKNLLQDLYS